MERYESQGVVGEGSYGTVLKCRHRESGRLVAIKKFMDSDDDKTVKKIALREIKLLRQLRHDNLVNLLEVWKRRRRWYLVFEFVERTLLDDLEHHPNGLDLNTSRQYLFQILRAVAFCHQKNIIHRDIKPENILISQGGVVKLCDFGFARTMTTPAEGAVYTDYVATRWYRAPELLVGDTKYGRPVDVWAIGCMLLEMVTGQPLFPGDSDLDQIYHIVKCFGNLTAHHQELFYRNPVFSGAKLPQCSSRVPLVQRFTSVQTTALDLAQTCLQMDPEQRSQCSDLLEHPLFTNDSFHVRFLEELNAKIQKHHRENSTLPKIVKPQRRDKDEGDEKNWKGKDKKQSEDQEEKYKEKGRKDKDASEDKLPKTKGKQPSKPKNHQNTSEPLMSTKQSKTPAAKIVDNTAKTTKSEQLSMKSKKGKFPGTEVKKETEISKLTKTRTFDASEVSRTVMDVKDNNTPVTKPKQGMTVSPEQMEGSMDSTETKDEDYICTHPNNKAPSLMEIQRPSKQEPSQSSTNSSMKGLKLSKSSTSDRTNEKLPPKPSLKSMVDHTDADLPKKMGVISTVECLKGSAAALTSKIPSSDPEETSFRRRVSQPSSYDHIESVSPTVSSVAKPCKTTATSEHQDNFSSTDTEQRQRPTSQGPKVIPKITTTSNTTSNHNISLSTSPLKTQMFDLSAQSSVVFTEGSVAHSATLVPKGTFQTSSSSGTKSPSGINILTSCRTGKEHAEKLIAPELGPKTSLKNIKKNQDCLTTNKTAAKHNEISDASSEVYKENPFETNRIKSQSNSISKISPKSRASTSMPDECPETPVPTTMPKTIKVLETREDLSLSDSTSPTTSSPKNPISKVSKGSITEQAEHTMKSSRPSPSKSLIEEPKNKRCSFNASKSPPKATSRTQKTTFPMENSISFFTATPDHNSSTRIFPNPYTADKFDFREPDSSPPPPPPPPSSTPLLLPPSSTSLVPSASDIRVHSPAASDHFALGVSFHRGAGKPRHPGGICSRSNQQSSSSHTSGFLTAQVTLSDKSQTGEQSFLSDRCNIGNCNGFTGTKKKSDVVFPDLRSSVLPELKSKEGKLLKNGTLKDPNKEKHLVPSISSSDPQEFGHNSKYTQTH